MNFRVFCASAFLGCLCSTSLSAEPIRINPYPEQEAAQAEAPEAEVQQQPATVETEIIIEATLDPVIEEAAPAPAIQPAQKSLSAYKIPQPGDSYFDAPSQDADFVSVDVAEDTEMAFVPAMEEPSLEPAYEREPENLRVRMSESFDEMVVNQPFNDTPAEEVASLPPPVVLEPQPTPAPEPERIAWFSSRQAPQTNIKQVTETRDDGLVRIALNDSARTDELLSEEAPAGQKWRALEGANIRQVLKQWAQMEGAKLVWDNQDAFAVLQGFEVRGPFHSAVKSLLDQYQNNQVRPVATLHVDPQTSQQTLVIRVLDGA